MKQQNQEPTTNTIHTNLVDEFDNWYPDVL